MLRIVHAVYRWLHIFIFWQETRDLVRSMFVHIGHFSNLKSLYAVGVAETMLSRFFLEPGPNPTSCQPDNQRRDCQCINSEWNIHRRKTVFQFQYSDKKAQLFSNLSFSSHLWTAEEPEQYHVVVFCFGQYAVDLYQILSDPLSDFLWVALAEVL